MNKINFGKKTKLRSNGLKMQLLGINKIMSTILFRLHINPGVPLKRFLIELMENWSSKGIAQSAGVARVSAGAFQDDW